MLTNVQYVFLGQDPQVLQTKFQFSATSKENVFVQGLRIELSHQLRLDINDQTIKNWLNIQIFGKVQKSLKYT